MLVLIGTHMLVLIGTHMLVLIGTVRGALYRDWNLKIPTVKAMFNDIIIRNHLDHGGGEGCRILD